MSISYDVCYVYCAVPSTSPSNVTGRSVGLTWIQVEWSVISGRDANGVIVNYIVEMSSALDNDTSTQYTVGSINKSITANAPTSAFHGAEIITFSITGLNASTLYMVRVAASTSVGRGPFSEWVDIRTSKGENFM